MADTKSRIIEAGQRAFYLSGFAAIRVEDVLQEANVSRGSFYKFFDGKIGLVEEVLKKRAARYEDFLAEAIRGSDGLTKGVSAIFLSLSEWSKTHGAHGCLFQTSIIELGNQPKVVSIAIQHKQKVQQILREFLAMEDYPKPDNGALLLMQLIEGAVAMASFDSPKKQFMNALDNAQTLLKLP